MNLSVTIAFMCLFARWMLMRKPHGIGYSKGFFIYDNHGRKLAGYSVSSQRLLAADYAF